MRWASLSVESGLTKVFDMPLSQPEFHLSNPPTRTYTLRIDVFDGQQLPIDISQKGLLHFQLGPYFFETEAKTLQPSNNKIEWNLNLPEQLLTLPADISQIPDMFVYFCDESAESRRMSYARLSPEKFCITDREQEGMKISSKNMISLKEEHTLQCIPDNKFPGFVTANVNLYAYNPEPREFFTTANDENAAGDDESQNKWILKVMTYCGRDFPTAADNGACNPYLTMDMNCGTIRTNVQKSTLNPEWYQT
jgi:hypothetical protein